MSALATMVVGLLVAATPGPAATAATTWYVAPGGSDGNTCTSSSSPCQHIQTAINRAASGDAISIAAGTYTETVSISTSLALMGAGAGMTVIDGDHQGTVVTVAPASIVTLTDVTIQDGNAGFTSNYWGGGIYNRGDLTVVGSVITQNSALGQGYGGGIANEGGTLTLIDSTISANSAVVLGGEAYGGGIYNGYNGGTLTLTDSTISDNGAYEGGGIYNYNEGTLILANSTVWGNGAYQYGGGIYNGGVLTLADSTVSNNSASYGFEGGGIYSGGVLTLTDTILAGNSAGSSSSPDCFGTLISGGYNLVGIGDGCGLTNGVNGDQVGTSSNPINPALGPLQDNGGPTDTMALLPGSPAIDYVPPSTCTVTTDQRGAPRPDERSDAGYCDIGAYEYQAAPIPVTITSSATSGVVGQSISLTGTGFTPNEPIGVYWDVTTTVPLTTATASLDGAFAATLTVPQAISGTHTIITVGQSSGLTATAPFTVTPSATLLHASGIQGSRNVITDDGFGADEQVTTYWGNRRAVVLAISTTNATGTAALTFTVPMSPTGTYQVVSVGQTSGAVVTAAFTLKPHLSIAPTSGAPGSHTYASGMGFGARERVSVKWNCPSASCVGATTLGTATTNRDGNFTLLRVTVPATATVGTYPVGAVGRTSHAFAASYFTVT